jgi:hypothetical protein
VTQPPRRDTSFTSGGQEQAPTGDVGQGQSGAQDDFSVFA